MLAEVLREQMFALAGVSERELRVSTPVACVKQRPAYPQAEEPVKEMIRFRDRYPFLKSKDCPDQLKVMVADMFTAYDSYRKAHERLASLPDEEIGEAFEKSREVVENYLSNRKIWETLDYYKEHGTLPSEFLTNDNEVTPNEEISRLTDLELASKLKSAVANESKHRKVVKASEQKGERNERAESQLQYWINRKKALQEEMNKRKKNK